MRRLSTDRTRAVLPFAVVMVAGLATVLLPPYNQQPNVLVEALACAATVLVCLGSMSVLPEQHRLLVVPVIALFAVLGLARDVSGGANSGLAPLVIVPVLWVVLYGTRLQLRVSGVCTAVVFILPVLVVGAPRYDVSDWRRGVLWALVVLIVCPVLQRQVEKLCASAEHEKALAGQLHSMLRAATEHCVIVTDLAGTITLFSEGGERMLGHRAVDIVGRRDPSFLHDPDEVVRVAAELGIAPGLEVFIHDIPAGGVGKRRWSYLRHDGSRLRVDLTMTRLTDDDGRHTGWIAIAQDVTAEEQVEHRLVGAEKRWRALMDHLPETVVLVVGPELEYRVAMGAGLALQGLKDLQGQTLHETSSETNRAILEPLYRSALEGGGGSAELVSSTTDSIFEMIVVPLPENEGDAEALVVARDVSAVRRREMDLRMAGERFERLFDEAPNGIMLLDGTGTVTQVNVAFCDMVGCTSEAVEGQSVLALPFMTSDQPSRLDEFVDGSLSRLQVDRTVRPGEPGEAHLSVTAVALRDDDRQLQGMLVTVVDVSERTRHEAQLSHLADHDPVTGLANRRRFAAELTSHLERCRRDGPHGALLMLDLDNFKQVNDTLGHAAGDRLIGSVAEVLSRRMRSSDVVARLGGDEFAVLLADANQASAEVVARDLVERIREAGRVMEDGTCADVTTSIGVVCIRDSTLTSARLMSLADLTMYDAKIAGRDCFAVHSDGDESRDGRPGRTPHRSSERR